MYYIPLPKDKGTYRQRSETLRSKRKKEDYRFVGFMQGLTLAVLVLVVIMIFTGQFQAAGIFLSVDIVVTMLISIVQSILPPIHVNIKIERGV